MEYKVYSCFSPVFIWWCVFYYVVLIGMGKIRLYVSVRKQGARIESVPLRRLVRLSKSRVKHWIFKDGWLILEAHG